MDKAIAKFSRINHMEHITGVLPLLTAVFGVQCYLMSRFTSSISTGDLALGLGLSLVFFVCALFYYDKNHVVLIYKDHIKAGMTLGQGTRIDFAEIESVIAPKEEKGFGTLVLKLKDGRTYALYFIDFPVGSKEFLELQMHKMNEEATPMAA
ncbi:MAG: hypothetical protein CME64_12980 [Halobacteriovoraceae bacterium]|nr:hypothetical protein [Halobacteriovoraceae bacterium]|tara:strand:+ start:100130 stop:100585 length:456 start_codon:yes stop_codon:yes gene_type:complete